MKNSIVTKYYFAGTTRLAVRKDGTLSYLLGDHLGSSSVTTDANGAKTASALYKAFGETRYTLGSLNTDYHLQGNEKRSRWEFISSTRAGTTARWDGSCRPTPSPPPPRNDLGDGNASFTYDADGKQIKAPPRPFPKSRPTGR